MWSSAAAALLAATAALPALVFAGDDCEVGDGYVRFAITVHNHKSARGGAPVYRRQVDGDVANQAGGSAYTIQLGMGSPSQPQVVQLDTGSTDLWVNPQCANAGGAGAESFCDGLPTFSSAASTTFKSLHTSYTLQYGVGSATVGWSTDTVTVGSASLTAQQFGLAKSTSSLTMGILGIGPKTFANQPDYPYFIDTLAAQHYTNSRAFSLDLRDKSSSAGAVIFGGLDTGKFSGPLQMLPIIPEAQAPNGNRYWVTLDTVAVAAKTVSTTSFPVMLDSGSTLMRLPSAVYSALGAAFPTSKYDSTTGYYFVDCDVASLPGTVDFTFAGKTIQVSYSDATWLYSTNTCILGAQAIPLSEDPPVAILGDSFLRAAYVIFDQDNSNVHLAQAADCGTNVVAIGKGADAVPSVTGDCPALPTLPSTTITTTSSSTTSSSSTSSSTTSSTTTSSNTTSYTSTTTTPPPALTTTHAAVSGTSSFPTYPSDHSSVPFGNLTVTATYTATRSYIVTSCPPAVTDCPVGSVSTETYTTTTTFCPGTETTTFKETTTSKAPVLSPTYPTSAAVTTTTTEAATIPYSSSTEELTTTTTATTTAYETRTVAAPTESESEEAPVPPVHETVYTTATATVYPVETETPVATEQEPELAPETETYPVMPPATLFPTLPVPTLTTIALGPACVTCGTGYPYPTAKSTQTVVTAGVDRTAAAKAGAAGLVAAAAVVFALF